MTHARRHPHPRRRPTAPLAFTPAAIAALAAIGLGTLLPGCYVREVSRRSLLGNAPTAEGASLGDRRSRQAAATGADESRPIRYEDQDGTTRLRAQHAGHVLRHTIDTLQNDERDLFTNELLSRRTHDQFAERGRPITEAFDRLRPRLDDIRRLQSTLPFGEFTPGAERRKIGRNLFLIYSPDAKASGHRLTGVIVSWEQAGYRLQWFTDR